MKIVSRFAFASVLLGCASPVLAGTGPWTVSEAAGKVTMTDASGSKPVARGTVIPAGATLSTGAGARAVMVRGPEFVTVSANSRLRVAEAAQQSGLVQILQDWGNALFHIDKQPNPHFAVKTPYLAAVVKGTTFSITVTQDGASMQVVEGAVEVSTDDGGARDLIRPGSVAMVAAGDRYRLSVQGTEARTIDSPVRGTAPATDAPAPVVTPNVEPPSELFAAQTAPTNVIAEPIQAKPIDFGSVTGGLITGGTAVALASTVVSPATNTAVASVAAPVQLAANTVELPPVIEASRQPVAAEIAVQNSAESAAPSPATAVRQGLAPEARSGDTVVNVLPGLDKGSTVPGKDVAKVILPPLKPDTAGDDGLAKGPVKAGEELAKNDAKPADDSSKGKADKAADDLSKAQAKAADDAAKDAAKAADDAAKAAAKLAEDVAKGKPDKALDDTAKAQPKAAEDPAKDAGKAADDLGKAQAKSADDAAKDAKKAADDAAKATDDAAKAAAKAADDSAKDAKKAAEDRAKAEAKATDDAAKAAAKAADDSAKDAKKAADDLAKAQAKAADDAAKDAAKGAGKPAEDAKKAADDQAKAAADAAKDAAKAAQDTAKDAAKAAADDKKLVSKDDGTAEKGSGKDK